MYKKILVAHEKLNDAICALEKAETLARQLGAELFVLGIYAPGPEPVLGHHQTVAELENSDEYKRLHALTLAWAQSRGSNLRVETHAGHPIQLIEQFAAEYGADLLVLGDVGHTPGWGRMLDGSAERVGRYTGCDVLIVR